MDDLTKELVAALELSIRYLEHPDVAAMDFALPVANVAARAKAAINRAKGARDPAPVAVEGGHQQLDLLAAGSEVAGDAPL